MSSVEMKLSLPDALADEARKAGLLQPEAIQTLLQEELDRRRSRDRWARIDAMRQQGGPSITPEELETEIDAVRAERQAKNANRS